ncbi:MAG: hypothetical protein ABWY12_16650 [Burkholderiales bacterium]
MTLMDTAQLLGNLGDFLGAIVVTATLIYLAVQVRQSTKALHAQSRYAAVACSHAELLAAVEHPDMHLAMVQGASALSPEENIKVAFWLLAAMRSREFAWLQHRNGLIDEVQWKQESLIIQALLGTEVPRRWWGSVGRLVFAPEFVAFVDSHVQNLPVTNEGALLLAGWSKDLAAG